MNHVTYFFLQLKSYITLKTSYKQNPVLTIGILWFLLRGACVALAPGEQMCSRGVGAADAFPLCSWYVRVIGL